MFTIIFRVLFFSHVLEILLTCFRPSDYWKSPFVLENLSILESDKRCVLDAEEDSQRTFGMGGGATHASESLAGSVDAASIASEASGGGGQQT